MTPTRRARPRLGGYRLSPDVAALNSALLADATLPRAHPSPNRAAPTHGAYCGAVVPVLRQPGQPGISERLVASRMYEYERLRRNMRRAAMAEPGGGMLE